MELRFPVAGIGSRFLALLADSMIQFVALIVMMLFFVLIVSAASHGAGAAGAVSDTGSKWAVAGIILFYFLLYWGYYSLFEAFWNGQTPGKKLLKIRVIKDAGRQITFFEALARNLLRIIDMQLGYLVGVVCMLCNKQQKRLGDFVAGTIVVHERAEEQPLLAHKNRTFTALLYPQPIVELQPRAATVHLPAGAINRLQMQDLNIIDAFLTRALDLSTTTREEMARKLASRIAAKMQYLIPEELNSERFLEAVAYDMRGLGRP